MNLLLRDTHAGVESRRAGAPRQRVATALTGADNQLWLSPISIWEFLMLADSFLGSDRRRV